MNGMNVNLNKGLRTYYQVLESNLETYRRLLNCTCGSRYLDKMILEQILLVLNNISFLKELLD